LLHPLVVVAVVVVDGLVLHSALAWPLVLDQHRTKLTTSVCSLSHSRSGVGHHPNLFQEVPEASWIGCEAAI